MPNWKLTDQYAVSYPALKDSILSYLVFTDHTLDGTALTGTIDVEGTGVALETIGALLGVTSIAVSGVVTDANNTLTIDLLSSDGSALTSGFVRAIPPLGDLFSGVQLEFKTTLTNQADATPADVFNFTAQMSVGGHTPTLSMQIPMNGGLAVLTADPDLSVQLSDLEHLLAGRNQWPAGFPGSYSQGPALSLLQVVLNIYIKLQPFSVSLVAVTAVVGIKGLAIISNKLYLNPLAVRMTLTNPVQDPEMTYGLEGALALTNYANGSDYQNADFNFNFGMDLSNFSIGGSLEPPDDETDPQPQTPPTQHSVNTLLQDLFGSGTSIGLPDALKIDRFDFNASTTGGQVSDFSFDVAMSGGFGLFASFDIEEFNISLTHTAA